MTRISEKQFYQEPAKYLDISRTEDLAIEGPDGKVWSVLGPNRLEQSGLVLVDEVDTLIRDGMGKLSQSWLPQRLP